MAGCETGTQESTEEKRATALGNVSNSGLKPVTSNSWGIVDYFVADSQWVWSGYIGKEILSYYYHFFPNRFESLSLKTCHRQSMLETM